MFRQQTTILLLLVGSIIKAQTCAEHCSSKTISFRKDADTSSLNRIMPLQNQSSVPPNTVFIKGGTFEMGADKNDARALADEKPQHKVKVNDFWISETEITNKQFKEFTDATGYVTMAEKPSQNAEHTAMPAGSLVFHSPDRKLKEATPSDWWKFTPGANWRHPFGPNDSINGKGDLPVVHVSWYDANAYCKWQGMDLPTEAEWEYAAKKGGTNTKMNIWQGDFPYENTGQDSFMFSAPVKALPPNSLKVYGMHGNVWEWCSDWYHSDAYRIAVEDKISDNPTGPPRSFDPEEPYTAKKVLRGGSFLCNDSYCSGYRFTARMKAPPVDTYLHVGFRCVKRAEEKPAGK